ncbi:toprim domain-containing protein [Rhodobacteraceae bacterium M385]|nr:toprim domain-containing protein [Rhodobacteraceae bacterium M385]
MGFPFNAPQPIMALAQGRWEQILIQLGVEPSFLRNVHGPCPFCGGTDRYRFDNKGGNGTFFCNQCGAGNGVEFVKRWLKVDFGGAADEVRAVLGETHFVRHVTPAKGANALEQTANVDGSKAELLWGMGRQITPQDDAGQYLLSRGLNIPDTADYLRFMACCRYSARKVFPALISAIKSPDGRLRSIHKTFLLSGKKAPVSPARKVMKGPIPEGGAVPLAPFGRYIGVGEGIETSLAAGTLFEMPAFAALSSQGMERFIPPVGVEIVTVFADNDIDGCGQRAAETLAQRLLSDGFDVEIEIPERSGTDWNDVLKEEL